MAESNWSNSSDSSDMMDCDVMNIIFSSEDEDAEENRVSKKRRQFWVRDYYLERSQSGAFSTVFNKLRQDPVLFHKYTRMTVADFEELLLMVRPLIEKQTVVREPLDPTLRLAVTIRYLATGESQTSLSIAYKCSQTSVHRIVNETTKCIAAVLKNKVFPKLTEQYFKTIASGFEDRWNFPNCIGAIDGKHVTIQAPYNSGSEFFNYKKTSSIVLMAVCDHDYNFIMCDIGAAGRQSDGGVFRESNFGKRFYEKTLPIPQPRNITENFTNVPYVFVADDAFALMENMLKPFSNMNTMEQKIFNYRLSRARRMIENCFGILTSKWRIFKSAIIADLDLIENIVECCVCLHNWLRQKNSNYITLDLLNREVGRDIVPGSWNKLPNNLSPLQPMNRNASNKAKETREKFAHHFTNEGQVPWQLDRI